MLGFTVLRLSSKTFQIHISLLALSQLCNQCFFIVYIKNVMNDLKIRIRMRNLNYKVAGHQLTQCWFEKIYIFHSNFPKRQQTITLTNIYQYSWHHMVCLDYSVNCLILRNYISKLLHKIGIFFLKFLYSIYFCHDYSGFCYAGESDE